VRLQGFASSPTPETHVLDACAEAVPYAMHSKNVLRINAKKLKFGFMSLLL